MLYEIGGRLYRFTIAYMLMLSIAVMLTKDYISLPPPLSTVFNIAYIGTMLFTGLAGVVATKFLTETVSLITGVNAMYYRGLSVYISFVLSFVSQIMMWYQNFILLDYLLQYYPYIKPLAAVLPTFIHGVVVYYLMARAGVIPSDVEPR